MDTERQTSEGGEENMIGSYLPHVEFSIFLFSNILKYNHKALYRSGDVKVQYCAMCLWITRKERQAGSLLFVYVTASPDMVTIDVWKLEILRAIVTENIICTSILSLGMAKRK